MILCPLSSLWPQPHRIRRLNAVWSVLRHAPNLSLIFLDIQQFGLPLLRYWVSAETKDRGTCNSGPWKNLQSQRRFADLLCYNRRQDSTVEPTFSLLVSDRRDLVNLLSIHRMREAIWQLRPA
jgi:hypothetical protein